MTPSVLRRLFKQAFALVQKQCHGTQPLPILWGEVKAMRPPQIPNCPRDFLLRMLCICALSVACAAAGRTWMGEASAWFACAGVVVFRVASAVNTAFLRISTRVRSWTTLAQALLAEGAPRSYFAQTAQSRNFHWLRLFGSNLDNPLQPCAVLPWHQKQNLFNFRAKKAWIAIVVGLDFGFVAQSPNPKRASQKNKASQTIPRMVFPIWPPRSCGVGQLSIHQDCLYFDMGLCFPGGTLSGALDSPLQIRPTKVK